MRVAIIDDEPLAIRLLVQHVERHPDLELSGAYTDPITGLEAIQASPPDLLLLDIQMPELSGLHLARLVKHRCAVVFTTAYETYALRGFDLDAVDYLLKPISYERFCRAVEKTDRVISPPGDTTADIFVPSGNRQVRVALSELLYGSSAGDYLLLYLQDGSRIITSENLSDLVARMPAAAFCRIHRSHFVRLDKIDYVERRRVVIGQARLPIGAAYRTGFEERL